MHARTSITRFVGLGDVNAFFGLVLDNMSSLVILAGILIYTFGFAPDIVLQRIVPGTAVGVLVGDLLLVGLAWRLARRTGRVDVTAMPLGIDTLSMFGLSLGVLGPARLATGDDHAAWQIGMAVIVLSGLFKGIAALFGPWLRRVLPRAALLGSLAAISITFIAFLPALDVFASPVVGFVSLGIIIITVVARFRLPAGAPGIFVAVAVAALIHYGLAGIGWLPMESPEWSGWSLELPWAGLAFFDGLAGAVAYLPVAIPFAIAIVVGSVDVTESAAVAGDEYNARHLMLADGVATILCGLCGGVVQTTPFIGHPAYKAMGGRLGYVAMTGLFIGLGGMIGLLSFFVVALPRAAMAPILIYIGLEITSQAFIVSPRAHARAVVICFVPVIASLVGMQLTAMLDSLGVDPTALSGKALDNFQAVVRLGNGFIVSALLWGAIAAFTIDRRRFAAAAAALFAAGASLFGVIHSPLPQGRLFLPWQVDDTLPLQFAVGYALLGLLVAFLVPKPPKGPGSNKARSKSGAEGDED